MSRTHHHGLMKSKPWVKSPPGGYHWASRTPSWWVRLYMNQPKRAETHRLERKIEVGEVDVDSVIFPLGRRKPHVYYW